MARISGRKKGAAVRAAGRRCPDCGGDRFEEGTMALYNSISYIVFNSEKRPFVTLGNSLRARVCLGCGRVELYAPLKAFKGRTVKAGNDGQTGGPQGH